MKYFDAKRQKEMQEEFLKTIEPQVDAIENDVSIPEVFKKTYEKCLRDLGVANGEVTATFRTPRPLVRTYDYGNFNGMLAEVPN